MLKIFLVDDEVLVRTNIKLMLNRYPELYTVYGEASDGQEALHLIAAANPDVVISDMVMSPMNGLELCEKLHIMLPSCYFIALSNYDDYQLVRGTLKNGAFDYLLKHELSTESLHAVLSKLQPSSDSSYNDFENKESAITVLREKFVLDLLGAIPYSSDDLTYHLNALSLHLDSHQIYPVVMRIDNNPLAGNNDDIRRQRLQIFSVTNISNEILAGYPSGILTHTDNSYYCLLLSYESIHSEAEIHRLLHSAILQLSANLKNYLNLETSFSVGKICASLGYISSSYIIARRRLEDSFAPQGLHIITPEIAMPQDSMSNTRLDNIIGSQIRNSVIAADTEATVALINIIFDHIATNNLAITGSQMLFFDLIRISIGLCEERSIDINQIFDASRSPFDIMTQMTSLSEIKSRFIQLYSRLCDEISTQNLGRSPYVQKTISMITAHYRENLSLTAIADTIGISSGYLSTLFKSETGTGFNDYLNQVRISVSLKMLKDGNDDFRMIAANSGFQDYSYFFHVFKRKTGKTPSEYLAGMRSQV